MTKPLTNFVRAVLVLTVVACGTGPGPIAVAPIENRPMSAAGVPPVDAGATADPSCEDATQHMVALGTAREPEVMLDECRHVWVLSVRRCIVAAGTPEAAEACVARKHQ